MLCAEVVRFLRRESQQRKELKRESTRLAHSLTHLTSVNHPLAKVARFDCSSHVMCVRSTGTSTVSKGVVRSQEHPL
jgi:hypothetical protein